jgi:ABC-2 type transport system ATP-binding protein
VVLIADGTKVFDGKVSEACAVAPRLLVIEGALGPDALCGAPGIAGVTSELLEDGRLRLTAQLSPGAPVQAALKAAFARDLDISRLELKEPHLHDAFIALTGGPAGLQEVAGA